MVKRKQKELFPVKVTGKREIAPGVFTLQTERRFDFTPGQVVAVALNRSEEPRLYSIASGVESDHIRLLFDINPDGLLTPRMAKLACGDQLLMSEPFGRFLGSDDPAWWIATGTGIAPFMSMAESGIHFNKKLIHGARTSGEFWFSGLFLNKMGENYLRFATRENAPGINSGRLTVWLARQENLPKDIKYYLCGNANMVVEVRDILLSKGVAYDNVVSEIYF
ncbi:ferredoxin--NADP reductase [Anaerophaga thermohalophila]|uniref:ferredoxin--NADP reductase n=1 Tax=Anaerophaga thermohalophila TaxID=177400 RepID=UPI00030C8F51|nr:FAD-binding oxidoreductase [Anaerophaga thermohalophila]